MQFSGHVAVAQTTPLNLVVLPFGNAWQDFGQIWISIHVDLHRCEWEEGEGDKRWISTAPRLYFSCFPILLWVNWVFLVVSLTRDVTVSITPCSGTWEAVWIERWLSPVQSKSLILTWGEPTISVCTRPLYEHLRADAPQLRNGCIFCRVLLWAQRGHSSTEMQQSSFTDSLSFNFQTHSDRCETGQSWFSYTNVVACWNG